MGLLTGPEKVVVTGILMTRGLIMANGKEKERVRRLEAERGEGRWYQGYRDAVNEERISFSMNDVAEKLKGTPVNFGGRDNCEQINS